MYIHITSDLVFTHFAITSIGNPNTPELIIPGLLPMEAKLVKYSNTRVTFPCGWSFISTLQRLLDLRSFTGIYTRC